MSHETNPAGRLYTFFTEVKKSNPNEKCYAVWGRAFSIEEPEKNRQEIYHYLLVLYRVTERIESLLTSTPEPTRSVYLERMPTIRRGITEVSLDHNWSEARKYLTDEVISSLKYCSAEIHRHYDEQEIKQEELNSLRVIP